MRIITHTIDNQECTIHVPLSDDDIRAFELWMRIHANEVLAGDTETTGGSPFSYGFDIRLLQVGNATEAWVINAQRFRAACTRALREHARWSFHNFAYDSQAIDKALGIPIEEMTPKVMDTIILSKLVEPHRPQGHHLKGLSSAYIDRNAPDTQAGLQAEFRAIGATKETGWALISIDNETYLRYAGLDVILDARLLPILLSKAKARNLGHLVTFEHSIQGMLNVMRRRGLLVDLDYAAGMRDEFLEESAFHLQIARDEYGLENLNSPTQVAKALIASGAQLTETTDSGQFKTGKEVLLPLAGMDEYWEEIDGFVNPNPLALHIAKGKRAERFANAYLGKFIDLSDPAGRIHPDITGLQARTSRMAVSDPPLQQLPSKDWKVRRAILADPGNVIISADYAQVELRILAELAGIVNMKEAIAAGVDLHGRTAELAYGPNYTKANRVHMKGAAFGKAYGGGATGLSRKMGITMAQAKSVVQAFDRAYPELNRWSKGLQRSARQNHMVLRSPSGRILALDRDRVYAATNYVIQSTAADVMKNALEALWDAGLGDHLLMPVHDEIIAQAPEKDAADLAHTIGEVMTSKIGSVPLDAEGEVYGFSWGHGYTNAESKQLPLFTSRA